MPLEILGHAADLRTNTPVVYAKLPIGEYLQLVGDDFADFEIQRRREKHKAYKRMRQDIVDGALLPSITLAVKIDRVETILHLFDDRTPTNDELQDALGKPGQVHILDGLQRTYILSDLAAEIGAFKDDQTVLVEFWLERSIRNLIYRIIVLNAGQKPMSMRHQIELLFITVKQKLENDIPGLEIFTEREATRRTRSRKYPLDRVASAYQCFITRTPEVQRENIVAQKLVEEDVMSSSEEELGDKFDTFERYLMLYSELDDEVCRIYVRDEESGTPTGTAWFGSENVMNAFFAAISDFGSTPDRLHRIDNACRRWLVGMQASDIGADPLGLATLQSIIQGFNTRRVNVGFATRKLLFSSFKEYFRDEGATELAQCWVNEAE